MDGDVPCSSTVNLNISTPAPKAGDNSSGNEGVTVGILRLKSKQI